MVRTIIAFVVAALATTALACTLHTQFVLGELTALGVEVPPGVRLQTTIRDMTGLFVAYGGIISVALLLGFIVAAIILRFAPKLRPIAFPLAGAAALTAALIAMVVAFGGMVPIAGARTPLGLAGQALAGGIGGWVFAQLRRTAYWGQN